MIQNPKREGGKEFLYILQNSNFKISCVQPNLFDQKITKVYIHIISLLLQLGVLNRTEILSEFPSCQIPVISEFI
jgi:hypothetical protein